MVNATEMAKPFGKLAKDWLKTQNSKEFISVLSARRNILPSDLVKVVNGDNGGTWMHEDVALEFARWLSPAFAIWCNDRIKELVKFGITATPQTIESMIADPDNAILLLQELKKEREAARIANEERAKLQLENNQQQQQIHEMTNAMAEMQEKVSYVDRILACKSTITTTVIAQDYGMSAKAFNKKLYELSIQHKVGGQWILYAKYLSQGFVHSKAFDIVRKDGSKDVRYNTEWTQKGRLFLYETLKDIGILPLIERNS